MRVSPKKRRMGFTLVELTVAMMMGMSIAAMVLALFNQQLAFLRIYQTQNFLTSEAPYISLHVSKLVGRADRFRLHDSLNEALTGVNPQTDESSVVLLNYRQPDGTLGASILSFEDLGDGPELNYYIVPESGTLGAPEWSVTNEPTNVQFTMEQGVLRMIITGPAGEQIIYSGAMQR